MTVLIFGRAEQYCLYHREVSDEYKNNALPKELDIPEELSHSDPQRNKKHRRNLCVKIMNSVLISELVII